MVGAKDKVVVINEDLGVVRGGGGHDQGCGVGADKRRQEDSCVWRVVWLSLFSWVKPDKLNPMPVLKFHAESVESVAFSGVEVERGRLGEK